MRWVHCHRNSVQWSQCSSVDSIPPFGWARKFDFSTKGSTFAVARAGIVFSASFTGVSIPENWEQGIVTCKTVIAATPLFSLIYPLNMCSVQSYLPLHQPLLVQLLVDKCLKKSVNR